MSNHQNENPTGAGKKPPLRMVFDSLLKLEFHGSKITSDAGLLAYQELDAALGLTDLGENLLSHGRTGKNTQHSMVAQMRQSIFSRLAGYEDTNDAERLAVDPTMRQVVGGRATEHAAASTSQMGRFETEVLTQPSNLKALTNLSGKWIDRLRERQPMRELILDMDSSVSETYGEQEGTAFNGHFGCTCYHPLFCFNQFGDVEQSLLRDGKVHSAKDWRAVLEPVVARYQGRNIPRKFRADAAFANPDLYEYLEAEGFEYAIRLPANDALQRDIEPLLTRPVGRPSNTPVVWYAGFLYQAKSWDRARRVVAKVEWHNGELFPRVGFIVTNLIRPAKRVVRFYNQRGTAEQWIKEGKNVRQMDHGCPVMTLWIIRCAAATVRAGLQPGQLSATAGGAALSPAGAPSLDADNVAGEIDQDWGQSGASFPEDRSSRWRKWRCRERLFQTILGTDWTAEITSSRQPGDEGRREKESHENHGNNGGGVFTSRRKMALEPTMASKHLPRQAKTKGGLEK